jgi:hypothetical protein
MPKRRLDRSKHKSRQKAVLSIAVTPETKADLDRASKASGRSLSAEAEHRIARSFRDDQAGQAAFEMGFDLAFGRRLTGLLMLLGHAARDAGMVAATAANDQPPPQIPAGAGKTAVLLDKLDAWIESPTGYAAAAAAINAVLDQLRPDGQPSQPHIFRFAGTPLAVIAPRLGTLADRLKDFAPEQDQPKV